MLIVGIDPGKKIGWAEVNLAVPLDPREGVVLVTRGAVYENRGEAIRLLYDYGSRNLSFLVACEGIQSYGGVTPNTAIETAYMVGQFKEAVEHHDGEFHIVNPPTHHCVVVGKHKKLKNSEFSQSLANRLFDGDVKSLRRAGFKNDHGYNALSVAVWLAIQKGLLPAAG